jgi:proline dehydrogenase
MLFRTLILKTSELGFVRRLVTQSFIFRPLVRRFVAGETLEEAIAAAEVLAKDGFGVSLDLLGENVATLEEARAGRDAYIEVIDGIEKSRFTENINISIKLTALGLDQSLEEAETNFRLLLTKAAEHDIFVRADMEASDYTEQTIAMVERVYKDHSNTGTVLQSMMRRSPDDVQRLIKLGCRVRVVKGAYLEDETVAYKEKAQVDAAYIEMSKTLLKNGSYPAIATHDEDIVKPLLNFIKEEKIEPARYEWQMLYGIRPDLQQKLLEDGHNVRVYVPYGSQWYPYFSRRLAERPANMLFIMKALLKGKGSKKALKGH